MSIPILKKAIPFQDKTQPSTDQPPAATARSQWQKWLKFTLRLGCTAILMTVLLRSVSWSTVLQKLHSLDDGELLTGLIVGLFSVILSAYQWQSSLDGEAIRMDLRRLVNLYLVGVAFNHFLPTGMGGDVMKAYYVGKESQNIAGSASAVVLCRAAGFVGILCMSLPTLLIWHALFSQELKITFLLSCLAMCTALGGALGAVIILPRLLRGRWSQNKLCASIIKVGRTLRKSFGKPRALLATILFGLLSNACGALNVYAYAVMLDIHIPLPFYMVAIPLISLIAFLPISINGYGLRESAFVYIFATVHVPEGSSLLLALIMDVQVLLFGVMGGCIYLFMGEKRKQIDMHKKVHMPARERAV